MTATSKQGEIASLRNLTVILLLAVAGVLLGHCAARGTVPTSDVPKKATFFCEGDKSIEASFFPGNDEGVDLKLSDGRNLSIPHAWSASGARYANADESFVFWNKGNTAFVTEGRPGHETYSGCVAEQKPAG